MSADRESRQWAMFCHLAGFAAYLIPLGGIIGPLVLWLIKREESPFVDQHGKAAVNYQITLAIAAAISMALIVVVVGILLLIALGIYNIAVIIIAAMRANEGKTYTYPVAIRFIK